MPKEFIRALMLTIIAEMGDKTQILAMTFATQYDIKQVLLGVLLGIGLNHGMAIIIGRIFSKIIPIYYIQIAIGIIFIIFAYLSLREEDEDEEETKIRINPILTVGLTFFIGELGDKSQLTAMSLAAEATYPLVILLGTTIGMVFTSGIGIFVGSKVGDRIPDFIIKVVASVIFLLVGLDKLKETLSVSWINYILILALIIEAYLIYRLKKEREDVEKSSMQLVAQELYEQTRLIKTSLDNLCLGEDICGYCSHDNCLVGYIREIIGDARKSDEYTIDYYKDIDRLIEKDYNIDKSLQALSLIIKTSKENNWPEDENFVINGIARYLEQIIFSDNIKESLKSNKYIEKAKEINEDYGKKLELYTNMD